LKKYDNDNYFIKVEGLNGIKFSELGSLFLNSKEFSVLIQTDKALYKANDKIQFRVLIIDGDTKPYDITNEIVEVNIFDPNSNRIKQWKNIELKNGVFKNEMKLSSEPILGNWYLNCSYGIGSNKQVISSIERGFFKSKNLSFILEYIQKF
jgi:CD109 antigen